ncbi:PadR family transcriptional regulator [Cellulomonas sp. H30R-01]|uniref:PadR family transcriptional regulator n=1 Tax=Cellulomonas sp. H30R-01 TaxID=2704467 RepID=UPI00138CE328|nr:PadR family transcriptional regulator [Cellulomonas sp. H30R-01]QHT56559.1 PadR family transcriptional regulator [Cellulomonas sp. H30R-01]
MDDDRDPQLLKGVLPMLVLATLGRGESYGYELVTRLQDAGLTDLAAGTLYPVLNRLEREGRVSSRLVASSAGPARKYYVPTDAGTAELARAQRSWQRLAGTVARVLDADTPTDPGAAPAPTDDPSRRTR